MPVEWPLAASAADRPVDPARPHAGHDRLPVVMSDFFLDEGELKVGDIALEVFHTPGHTPGSVTLYLKETGALFTGDLIFKEGLGRTDLPGGDGEQTKDSIRRIDSLGAEWLLSGHGDIVAGAAMVKENFERIEKLLFQYI